MLEFTAKIYKLGINPVVDPPENILTEIFHLASRSKGPVPVRGRLNGAEFIQTLVKYDGVWRLYINGEMLKASRLQVGDVAVVAMEYDARPRRIPMPAALAEALEYDETAKIAFANLPPSRQKEIFRYIGSLKTTASIARNVEKILRQLKSETAKPLARTRKPGK